MRLCGPQDAFCLHSVHWRPALGIAKVKCRPTFCLRVQMSAFPGLDPGRHRLTHCHCSDSGFLSWTADFYCGWWSGWSCCHALGRDQAAITRPRSRLLERVCAWIFLTQSGSRPSLTTIILVTADLGISDNWLRNYMANFWTAPAPNNTGNGK